MQAGALILPSNPRPFLLPFPRHELPQLRHAVVLGPDAPEGGWAAASWLPVLLMSQRAMNYKLCVAGTRAFMCGQD